MRAVSFGPGLDASSHIRASVAAVARSWELLKTPIYPFDCRDVAPLAPEPAPGFAPMRPGDPPGRGAVD